MKNYIIFGGTGFIGTHLANLIHETHPEDRIWSLDIVDPEKLDAIIKAHGSVEAAHKELQEYTTIKAWKSPVVDGETRKATYVYCDVRKPIVNADGTLAQELPFTPTSEDVVFNFAAVHRTPGHPDYAYFETNIRGAENVCAFCERYGIRNVVFTSSIAPYGAAEQLKEETTLPTPNTPYGISKLVAEKIHQTWQAAPLCKKFGEKLTSGSDPDVSKSLEKKLTIVRPGVVFGKGENGNFTRLYWGIKKHMFAYPGRKDTIKACIYVKELVRFIMWNVEVRETPVDIFNCTFEPAYTIEQIVKVIKAQTGLTQFVPYIPNAVIMPAAVCAQLIGSPMGICPARVKKLQISTNICGKKLASCGYKFKWTFEDAIVDWYNDNKRKYLK